MSDPFIEYKRHADQYQKLMRAPEANKASPEAIREWRTCCMEEKSAMQKLARRLTYDQKKEVGILASQIAER